MNATEIWINDLKETIVDESDLILFEESANCFLTGNYRASYIMSWIAIIESLKRKIKLFSDLGDSNATESIKAIDKLETDKKSTDRLIFEDSKKCRILNESDLSVISFLWEQRCLFAHPYNKQPDENEVKYIIGQSVKLVLGKELFYNKEFLEAYINDIATKPFFMPIEFDRIRQFAREFIARTPTELHPYLFKIVLFKIGKLIVSEEKLSELKKLRFHLIELFCLTPLSLDDAKWTLERKATDFPYECFLGFVHSDSWDKIPIRIKEMLISYLINEEDDEKLINLKVIVKDLIANEKLEDVFSQQFVEKLDATNFHNAISFYPNTDSKFLRITLELESWQFEQQNPVVDFLKEASSLDFINSLSSDEQFYLGRLLKICSSGRNWKAQRLVTSVIDFNTPMPDFLLIGIAYCAYVDWRNQLRIERDFIYKAITVINRTSNEAQEYVYNLIKETLDNHTINSYDRITFSQESLTEANNFVLEKIQDWNGANREYFENLNTSIENKFST